MRAHFIAQSFMLHTCIYTFTPASIFIHIHTHALTPFFTYSSPSLTFLFNQQHAHAYGRNSMYTCVIICAHTHVRILELSYALTDLTVQRLTYIAYTHACLLVVLTDSLTGFLAYIHTLHTYIHTYLFTYITYVRTS